MKWPGEDLLAFIGSQDSSQVLGRVDSHIGMDRGVHHTLPHLYEEDFDGRK